MKITFLGASGTVTGSSYVLTSQAGQHILIDLGMFQGTAEIEKLNYEPYEFDCAQLSGAVLTHAHLDHCGRLPILLSHGFKGRIYMTPATAELTALSLVDAASIAKKEHGTILYDKELALETIARFSNVEYHEPFTIADFTITMFDAGHLLGSASLEIVDNSATTDAKKIIFSGDLGNSPADLLEPTELMPSADVVVMESTYGDSLHPNEEARDIIQAEINAVESSGGTLLIPAFSLERTQELLHIIMHLKKTNKVLAKTPVFLDGPMAIKATEIYLEYTDMLNEHTQNDERGGGAFEFPGLRVTMRREESEGIAEYSGAKVIIAGGGMMTGGRIVTHAARYLPHPQNRLLIVGYQGEQTLGREIMEGNTLVTINEESISIKASINSTRSMSSHADQQQLLDWLKHIQGVKHVVLTHGEDIPRAALAEKIREERNITNILMPQLHESIVL